MNEIIKEIISKIKERYHDLYVDFDFDESENHYEIWYNDATLDSDESFQLFIGELIYDYLLPKKIFNVSFYYNYDKSCALDFEKSLALDNNTSIDYITEKSIKSYGVYDYQNFSANEDENFDSFSLAA